MILNGIIEHAEKLNYTAKFSGKGRYRLFNYKDVEMTPDGSIKVIKGYDIRVMYLRDLSDELKFNFIVDVCYEVKDRNDNPVNFETIVREFGSDTLIEVRCIQKDLIKLPSDSKAKINIEAARQKLIEDIIPFIEKIQNIELPCGLSASINKTPTRVIVGV